MKTVLAIAPLCWLMLFTSCSRNTNTHFTPVKLSPDEITYLKEDLKKRDECYDELAKMLACETSNRHYHSDLDSGIVVHQTRESMEYAVALLKTEDSASMQRAVDIIKTILPMQEKDTLYKFCGIWPYYPEDPLRTKKSPVDYNWADFMAVPLIDVIINHSDYIGKELVDEIKEAIVLSAKAIVKRDAQPDYTNIYIMGTYVCYVVGDICNKPELTEYAQKRLANFYDYTIRNKGFTEYNSPTYTVVAMDELLRMKQCIINPKDKPIVDNLYAMCWDVIARHYHRPSGQWCGPNLRSYNSLASCQFYRLLYNASNCKIELPGNYPRIPNVITPHKIPAEILPKFTNTIFPRLEVDTFVVANSIFPKDIIGKLYMTPSYALASVNQSYMWNQTRPLIAHWGTPDKPSYLQVRFLHNLYDFSAVNIFCTQDTNTVIAIFNIAVDGGDRHPNIDKIKDKTITASDLRLRIEAGGDLSGSHFILPKTINGTAHFISGNINCAIKIPYAGWNDSSGYWTSGGGENTSWADYVLYSGKNKTFNLNELEEAVVGLYLSISASSDRADQDVDTSVDGKYLRLLCRDLNLGIKALLKPAEEAIIKKDYEIIK